MRIARATLQTHEVKRCLCRALVFRSQLLRFLALCCSTPSHQFLTFFCISSFFPVLRFPEIPGYSRIFPDYSRIFPDIPGIFPDIPGFLGACNGRSVRDIPQKMAFQDGVLFPDYSRIFPGFVPDYSRIIPGSFPMFLFLVPLCRAVRCARSDNRCLCGYFRGCLGL